jgi:hypothetical protein
MAELTLKRLSTQFDEGDLFLCDPTHHHQRSNAARAVSTAVISVREWHYRGGRRQHKRAGSARDSRAGLWTASSNACITWCAGGEKTDM